ncbi:ABC-type lipoprotein release transport system permease subunit [Mariniflexile fucanivorans]|uniref:ABC-type lipoprotein release transport system permease subunit n=1 Tax=Mariniflexile fucanivorans TaxID=264023 RepID=A0A4R1RFW3_9FLAO|nr:FtsX-like permease family protein [Mariniflexile fucanivorans]TCL64865.1 ABC-type lipoprotein release transport system permease subunit [Mariniflexile fucanivorans]
MKLALQLAYKNLLGAGLRTWLNVAVLSFAFVIIIFFNGLMDGWNQQSKQDSIAWEYGNGHLRNNNYDPFDPFTLQDGHAEIPSGVNHITPVLIQQGTIYPEGRMVSVLLKGISPDQGIIKITTASFKTSSVRFPAIIGNRMASSAKLKIGDEVLLRWRDKNGTFDASNVTIIDIFDTTVAGVDSGQIWMPIETLWDMTGLQNHATIAIADSNYTYKAVEGWNFETQKDMLQNLDDIISMKKYSTAILYLLLLAIALLAIFDTQVLSIFRRQKEIGTYIALGMTRTQVVRLFTVEGSMYSILAMIVGCIYGVPLFIYLNKTGIGMPQASQDMGFSLADKIYPIFGIQLIIGTILLVTISATIVSFLPAKKISKMNPVLALKGKLQ